MSFPAAPGLDVQGHERRSSLVAPGHPPKKIRVVVGGAIDGADISTLCARVRAELADGHPEVVVFDVAGLTDPNLETIDALARARLIAHRDGCELRLADASAELVELLELAGLAETVPCEEEGSALDAQGQSEDREEARGVQEERDPADPAA